MADRIEQIEERLAKATPGMQADDGGAIWIEGVLVETHYVSRDMALDAEEPSMEGMPMEEQRQEQQQIGQMERTEDAEFIANAPSDLRYLLDALRESQEQSIPLAVLGEHRPGMLRDESRWVCICGGWEGPLRASIRERAWVGFVEHLQEVARYG